MGSGSSKSTGQPVSIVDDQPLQSDPITPHDSNDQSAFCSKGIWVGTGGTLVGRLQNDTNDRTWKNIANGSYVPGWFKLIKFTGTSAADILGYSGPT